MPPADLPDTRRDDLVEVLHDVEVADPYRWLEDATDPAVGAWVDGQRAASNPVLANLPARDAFRQRLSQVWSVPRRGAPWRRGQRWFQLRNDGAQNQDVLWTATAGDDRRVLPGDEAWQPLLDPNVWSEDGTATLSELAITVGGDRVAHARSDAGSDWMTWRVLDLSADGEVTHLDDEVPWSKGGSTAWLPGGRSLLYRAYDPPPPGEDFVATTAAMRVQRHDVATPASEDTVVHDRPDEPEWFAQAEVAHGDDWLVLSIRRGTARTNRVHLAPLDRSGDDVTVGPWRELIDDEEHRHDVVGAIVTEDGLTELVMVTDHDAPLGRIVAVDVTDGSRWRELVPESADRLESAQLVGGDTTDDQAWLVVSSLHHATSRVHVHDGRTGAWSHDVELPGLATVTEVTGGRTDTGIHIGVSSFVASHEVWHHDLQTRATTLVTPSAVPEPDVPVVTEQVLVHHRDHAPDEPLGASEVAGEVAVPVFLVHRADVRPTGDVPTVLWGYGGFDIATTPAFRPGWRAWIDAGGLLAVVCLRGGGEYGRAWHDAGSGPRRPAVPADALAVAAWLTGDDDGEVRASAGPAHAGDPPDGAAGPDVTWSAPAHLGVEGRSNGGLLVGTCMTSAPDRFGSAVPEVGVLDLLRFHRFTVGWAWASDYGSPDDPDQFPVLHGLSPYHRVLRDGPTGYPPTLVTTGDTDDRVVPAHSYKFAAALQEAQAGDAPVLLRIDVSAGHGAGKPVAKLLDERADVLAWHAHHLGLQVRTGA